MYAFIYMYKESLFSSGVVIPPYEILYRSCCCSAMEVVCI